MSENIQSISQGTYTIGQTSVTNFQAGPGIKIDQPSEGVVRIGNDETVLWTGTRHWWEANEGGITLSESPANFEYIRIKAQDDWQIPAKYYFIPGDQTVFNITIAGIEANSIVNKCAKYQIIGTSMSLVEPFTWQMNSSKVITIYTDRSYQQFNEVVGINRISGSNT